MERSSNKTAGWSREPKRRRLCSSAGAFCDRLGDRDYVLGLCEQAIHKLGDVRLKKINRAKGELAAKAKMNWDSFGTLITMRVAEIGESLAEVTITTRPRSSFTRIDYGRGLEAAEKLMQFLKENDRSVSTSLLKDGAEMLAAATKRPLAKDFDRKKNAGIF